MVQSVRHKFSEERIELCCAEVSMQLKTDDKQFCFSFHVRAVTNLRTTGGSHHRQRGNSDCLRSTEDEQHQEPVQSMRGYENWEGGSGLKKRKRK